MRQVNGYEVQEFIYHSKTARDYHVAEMEQKGWTQSGQVKRLNEEISLLDATEEDYEWYARFNRNTMNNAAAQEAEDY
ncbi:hypothetical protein AAG663_22610 (plasmid) [Bacillus licheniformis]|uniref:hypothetical protein n=1 Tax=Bacillus subtilis group TaxID=653685 RepID=UPI0009B73E85|nr:MULTISPECIES: hypothetical protein [Bacillus subtilis group]MCY1628328.1 hypothetical protein [Bacillus paralicheniformis]MDE1421955.1 hypothetical protein [Bacillus licheniformis]MEC0475960.1 hypothetical protein [Bacillus licheniformis]